MVRALDLKSCNPVFSLQHLQLLADLKLEPNPASDLNFSQSLLVKQNNGLNQSQMLCVAETTG